MPFTLPPITLTENQTSLVNIPGNLGSVTYLKMVNASPYLLAITNLLGGSDSMQPGEANVWPVPGLTTAVQVTPQQFGINPSIIPATVLVVTWYLEGEHPNGNYPVNFNTLSFLGSTVTTNASTPNSINQDEWTPFVLTGLVATKDGSVANKLDVTSGVAWLRQADQSLGRVAENATSFTTVQISSTYYLDLNPDGTYSFATSHSGQPNYLTIAQVTTDASGNIATVTDERQLSTTLLSAITAGIAGDIVLPSLLVTNVANVSRTLGGSQRTFIALKPSDGTEWDIDIDTSANLNLVNSLHGAVFGWSAQGGFQLLGGQATAGNFGAPVIVAQAINTQVTATTQQTILSFTPPANGLYRLSASFTRKNTGGASNMSLGYTWTDPNTGGRPSNNFVAPSASYLLLFSASMSATTSVVAMPVVLYASSANTILITFQDASGTPNDNVSAMIERLS